MKNARKSFSFLLSLAVMTTLPHMAAAQEGTAGAYVYAPDYCEFTATFPEEPHIGQMCEEKNPEACYDLVSYTKGFEMASTVKVDIICNPSDEETFNFYTLENLKKTVIAMTEDAKVQTHQVGGIDGEEWRQAGMIGLTKLGMDEVMYVAQLWSGKKSIMSVKAQIIGEALEESDALFAEILRSIAPRNEQNEPNNTSTPSGDLPQEP